MKQTSVYFVTFASRDENLISTERYSLTTHRSLKKGKRSGPTKRDVWNEIMIVQRVASRIEYRMVKGTLGDRLF